MDEIRSGLGLNQFLDLAHMHARHLVAIPEILNCAAMRNELEAFAVNGRVGGAPIEHRHQDRRDVHLIPLMGIGVVARAGKLASRIGNPSLHPRLRPYAPSCVSSSPSTR